MTKHSGKYLLNIGLSRFILLFALLFPHFLLSGARLNKIPALLPLPKRVVWNGSQYKLPTNANWLVQRISTKLPGVQINDEESYFLVINKDSAVLSATTPKGIFRGLQTVRQLTFEENGEKFVAGCSITDWPAFKIRGFMQDAGRNFMSLPLLKEQIDVMAAYKFNVFHFHVTDNPGWRLESKKYPQLHAASSMSRWPGNYYSQEDFLELVQYCAERYINLIPEFDIPGHCEAFRKAFALDSMSDPRVKPVLLDLIDELCNLVPKEKMPYIHLGTDEVWHKNEKPEPELLSALEDRIRFHKREVIVWRPGQQIEKDRTSITQLWSSAGKPKDGHRYIDSRLNYLNHLDPLAGVAQLYFDRICGAAHGDSLRMGGILCCWNDNNVTNEYDIIRQNPVYPGLLTYSETSWKGQPVDFGNKYLAKIPGPDSPLYEEFRAFETRLTRHRDLYFQGKPFPYVRQSAIEWSLIGPFENGGDVNQRFPVESGMNKKYNYQGKEYSWKGPVYGGTIHLRHFFGYPSYLPEMKGTVYAVTNIWSPKDQETGCWIGFHDWSRSGGRRGGPFPEQGQWHTTNPKVWINGREILPPVWSNPGLPAKSDEIPFTDENYGFREPSKIHLNKGWNQVLLKVPYISKTWKWMFTFVPVTKENGDFREIEDLKYSTNPQLGLGAFTMDPAFGEHMVLQQNEPIRFSGSSEVNEQIKLSFAHKSAACVAGTDGKWSLVLPQVPAGGPYPLEISVNGKKVVDWKDILVGDVWFCSGQSNMEFRLNQAEHGVEEAAKVNDDYLRLMNFRSIAATSNTAWDTATLRKVNQLRFFEGSWKKNSPGEAAVFSAIAYQFGKELRERLKVPVGLVQVTVGGAPAESFVEKSKLENNPYLSNVLTNWFNNEFAMEWCRQRAQVNLTSGRDPLQKHPFMPGYIFEAGLAPFTSFPIKGIIWYQGESNAENPKLYEAIFPELVGSLRQSWNNPGLPFIFAQLSSIQRPGWELFRDTQRHLAGKIPGTFMVITSDLGDSLNVHPVRKIEIGHRFALQALRKVYNKSVVADGPLPEKAENRGDSILEITFHKDQQLKTSDSKPLRELEVAGNDSIFHPVTGELKANKIVVKTGPGEIRQARYGWKPYTRGNLVNMDGLPASTFSMIVK